MSINQENHSEHLPNGSFAALSFVCGLAKSTRLLKNPCPWPDGLAKATRVFKNPQRFYREPAAVTDSENSTQQRVTWLYIQKDRSTRLVPGRSLGSNSHLIGVGVYYKVMVQE